MSLWQSMKQGPSFIYLKHSFHCMVLSELFHPVSLSDVSLQNSDEAYYASEHFHL